MARFLGASLLGLGFFLLPLPWRGRVTVLFDIVVSEARARAPETVSWLAFLLVWAGAAATLLTQAAGGSAATPGGRPS